MATFAADQVVGFGVPDGALEREVPHAHRGGGVSGCHRGLDFREFCRRSKLPRSERSWNLFAAERYRRGETSIPSYEAYNPFRHRQPGPLRIAPCREAVFSKLDALTRFLTPFLPTPPLRCAT